MRQNYKIIYVKNITSIIIHLVFFSYILPIVRAKYFLDALVKIEAMRYLPGIMTKINVKGFYYCLFLRNKADSPKILYLKEIIIL
ncbi:hypothetical protein CQ022_10990 [Chryseobacterium culicis]|uniref:Uncharacterized protein n=1 Tax=Chryseobacterium culicis TaxID=680127 RepID=A0A2S9D1W0_CHRCI|nr:hypothetical protein CQ022_10990 [Chryseobacterium culicis]PRB92500.1 hypothetical protein CQ033_04660 [Chryseobacterium culicis]